MATPLATPIDVEARGHAIGSAAEQAHIEHLLRLGSALLRRRFPDLDARVAAGDPDEETVKDVLVAMVLRVPSIANPGGIRSETIGEYSVTYESSSGSGDEEIGITAQEVALLAPVGSASTLFGSARLRAMLS